ncbi:MAG: CRISPR-associated endonuclease Cas2 [Spirochaetes bacterium]|nr:MAG: CRISPR-associated endonuclease Cas2 [Spirochaetota bacterium]
MAEVQTYVIYDIEEDKTRNKVAEACKDYGLERVQYSTFLGSLNQNKRGELYLRLFKLLGKKAGKIIILPVCDKDVKQTRSIVNEPDGNEIPQP